MEISPEFLANVMFARKPSADPQPKPRKLTMAEMAAIVKGLALGALNQDRTVAGSTYAFMSAQEAADLRVVASALEVMAPYADAIRRLIERERSAA